ncbi:uncharacterized protein [Diabrotica undecimpunctata]|uniref:uncharacterized protein isoform X1 n=1 Tax=Diabrotica undecimpunctata TaxID=50387 RepID=UPI003B641240
MECEGVVTKVDPYYGYLELDKKYKIHLSILKIYDIKIKLPRLHSKIIATNLHISSLTCVACENSKIKGDLTVDFKANSFTHLIKKYSLGVADLLMIDRTLEMLKKSFIFKSDQEQIEILLVLLETVIKPEYNDNELNSHICLNNWISDIDIIPINRCKYVEIISDKYHDFPVWSFGVHYGLKKNSLLFGFLYVDPQYGFLMMKDNLHKMVCIITNQSGSTDKFADSFVILTKYKVVTEIFKDSRVPNLEYLIVDFKDINILSTESKSKKLYGQIEPSSDGFKNAWEFGILRKSTVCIGQNKNPEAYLQISVSKENDNNINEVFYLTLPSAYINILLFLKEGFRYRLHHNISMKEIYNSELMVAGTYKNFLIVENSAYFQELGPTEVDSKNQILEVQDCKKYMSKTSNMVLSFEGVVRNRGFVQNFSQTNKRTSLYGFSTPGSETHTLIFGYLENQTQSSLVVYLSNWINQLMPLGLIPEMRVRVNNVKPMATYMKSTIFTTIEILSYMPRTEFHAVNLYGLFEGDWGSPYFLSKGNSVPHGVIVWSKVFNVHILQVDMTNSCNGCNRLIEISGACAYCKSELRSFKFNLIMHVTDLYGLSKIIVKDPQFLRIILDLSKPQFVHWFEAFQNVGQFSFNIHNKENQFDKMFDTNNFKNMLTGFFITFNKSLFDGLELKCRKMFQNVTKNAKGFVSNPLWFYLDGRKS